MTKQKIKEVMASVFEIDVKNIHDNASQKNLEAWDSLQHLNLAVELEEAFGIELTPNEISHMTSLDAIVNVVENREKVIGKK